MQQGNSNDGSTSHGGLRRAAGAALVLLAALTALDSCTGARGGPQPPPADQPQPPVTAVLPAVEDLDRRAAGIVNHSALGREAWERTAQTQEVGDALAISGTPGVPQWGLWRLGGLVDPREPLALSVQLNGAGTQDAWIALADYSEPRWRFFGPVGADWLMDLQQFAGWDFLSPAGNVYAAVLAGDGSSALVELVELTIRLHDPPVARFTALPVAPHPGSLVHLNASGSSADPPDTVVRYVWDLDGDGVYEADGGASPLMTTTLPDPPGTVEVGLRVTDSFGATGETTLELTSPWIGWITTTVDTGVGQNHSLAVVDGRPAVSYSLTEDGFQGAELRYAINSDPDGLGAWTIRTVHNPSGEGSTAGVRSSLAQVSGVPAIFYSHHDMTEPQATNRPKAMYAWAADPDGSAWNLLQIELAVTAVGNMALINGKPAGVLSRHEGAQARSVRYVFSTADDGSFGWSAVEVHAEDPGGFGPPALALVNGTPAIAFTSIGSQQVIGYAHTTEPDGSGNWQVADILQGPFLESFSVLEAGGRPIVSFHDGASVNCVLSELADGSGDWELKLIEAGSMLGPAMVLPTLALVQGLPALAYLSVADMGLDTRIRLARSQDADGGGDWEITAKDDEQAVFGVVAPAEVDGRPAVLYAAPAAGSIALRFAVLYE